MHPRRAGNKPAMANILKSLERLLSVKIPCLRMLCLMALDIPAFAADIRDTACRTTAECQAEADMLRGVSAKDATSARAKARDQFYWLGRINMGTAVMTVEEGVVGVNGCRESRTVASEAGE